jgi:hypothetical protein
VSVLDLALPISVAKDSHFYRIVSGEVVITTLYTRETLRVHDTRGNLLLSRPVAPGTEIWAIAHGETHLGFYVSYTGSSRQFTLLDTHGHELLGGMMLDKFNTHNIATDQFAYEIFAGGKAASINKGSNFVRI